MINSGRIGITTLETMRRTIFWNSSSRLAKVFARVQAAVRPSRMESTSALITLMICGISSWNTASGRSRRPSVTETMDRCGMIA